MQSDYEQIDERRNLVQSYIWTIARYDFNVYEKRIIYRIIEKMQSNLQGLKLNADQRAQINRELFEYYDIELPIIALLTDEEDRNHARIKEALKNMQRKLFEYEDAQEWRSIPLISLPRIRKHEQIVKFKLHEDVYNAFMNFSKGFKKYELQTAFKLESAFSMRFYELFASQTRPITYTIVELKKMFGAEKKYKQTSDFIKKVIQAAKKELDEKSPISFEYGTIKAGKRIIQIKFFPIKISANLTQGQKELNMIAINRKENVQKLIDKNVIKYIQEGFNMSIPEIKNNTELFLKAQKKIPDIIYFLSEVKPKANRAENPKGYLINSLKKKIKQIEEKEAKPIRLRGESKRTESEPNQVGDIAKKLAEKMRIK
jgi:plasmid replication initiation protein